MRLKWISWDNFIPIVFIFVLTFLFFYKIFLNPTHMLYPATDLGIYSAWKNFFVKSFQNSNKIPLWNPYLFSGSTFVGSGQSAMFYPINVLYLIFPIELIFGYIFVLNFFLIGLFTYLYCRTIKLNRFSSIIAAICFEYSGTIVLKLYPGHIFIVDGIVWFPLMLLFFELAIQFGRYRYGLFAGIPTALMFLSGNAQIALYGYTSSCIYFILRLFLDYLQNRNKFQIFKIIFVPLISLFVGLALSAIQLLPSYEFSKLSTRMNGVDFSFASSFSLPPKQLISFILPHFFGSPLTSTYWGKGNFWELNGYIGLFPLLLTFISLCFIFKNKYIITLFALVLFSLFFSFGSYSLLYKIFYNYIPGFNLFRVPARFLFVYAFSVSVLAGIGVQYIYSNNLGRKINFMLKKLMLVLTIGLSILISLFIFILTNKNSFFYYEKYVLKNSYAVGFNHRILFNLTLYDFYYLIILLAISIVIIFLIYKKINFLISKSLVISLIITNLFLFGSKFYDTKNSKDVFNNPSDISIFKENNEIFRVFDLSGRFIFSLPRNFIQSLTGYDAIYLKDYRDFLWKAGSHEESKYESFFQFYSVNNLTILKLLNTKYIISKFPLDIQGLKLFYKDSYYIYKLSDYLPRAYMVGNGVVMPDRHKILNRISEPNFNYKELLLFEKATKFPLKNQMSFRPIPLNSYSPDKITITTNLENSGYLVLSEIWYPGWKAYVNEKETEIYKVNYLFRSIYLKKGESNITFLYKPNSFIYGRYITMISVLLILGFFLLKLYRSKRNKLYIF